VSVCSFCDTESSPQRGYFPSRPSAGQLTSRGLGLPLDCAALGFAREGWVSPVDVLRMPPTENSIEVAAQQVKRLLDRTPGWCAPSPLFVFHAAYYRAQSQSGMEG
jgi:hypothetical protein